MTGLLTRQETIADILPPGQGRVQVQACPHPFRMARTDFTVPAGLTLAEIVARVQPDPALMLGASVFLGDEEIPRQCWPRVRPKPGTTVSVRVAPAGGGGKNPLRTVLLIAVLVAAVVIPGAQPFAGTLLASGTIGGSLFGAAIGLAGSLLVNALVPASRPKAQELSREGAESPTYSISGARSDLRPFEPVPRVLGEHRITAPLGARTYTEIVGDNQYLRMLAVWGYGPLHLRDFKVGETPLTDFKGVEVEHRQGFDTDPPITLFPNDVFEEPLAIALTAAGSWQTRTTQPDTDEISLDFTWPLGLVEFDALGNKLARTVEVEVQYAPTGTSAWSIPKEGLAFGARNSGVLAAPTAHSHKNPGDPPIVQHTRRIYRISLVAATGAIVVRAGSPSFWEVRERDGALIEIGPDVPIVPSTEVTVARVERRSDAPTISAGDIVDERPAVNPPFGSGGDFVPSANGTQVTIAAGTLIFPPVKATAARSSVVRKGLRFRVARGQYDVRCRRVTPDAVGQNIFDTVSWTTLRSINEDPPINMTGLAQTALRILATEQLGGVIQELNCVATSILPDWNGTDWSEVRPTSNPAALFREVAQGKANAKPRSDAQMDLTTIEAWHETNSFEGRTFNAVIDFRTSVRDLLADIAIAGRAGLTKIDNKWGVAVDEPKTIVRQHFTPRNSRNFRATRTFQDLPHALRVRFINRDKGWRPDERIVYRDGFDAQTATDYEGLEEFGVTDSDHAWMNGRYYFAVAQLRPERYEFETDIQNIIVTRGDRVAITHDVILVGLASGRVKSIVEDGGGNLTGLTLDEAVPMEVGKSYGLSLFAPVVGQVKAAVDTVPGEQTAVTLTTPLAPGHGIGPATMFGFAEVGLETLDALVHSIRRGRDDTAILSCVPYSPAVFEADFLARAFTPADVNSATDRIGIVAHGFVDGALVGFSSDDTLPGGLDPVTDFWVINATLDDFQVSLTQGGAAVDLSDGGLGTHSIQRRIPPFQSQISAPAGLTQPSVLSVRSDETVMARAADGSLDAQILVTLGALDSIALSRVSSIEARFRPSLAEDGPWTPLGPFAADTREVGFLPVETGVAYDLRLRFKFTSGQPGPWAEVLGHTVIGKSGAPNQPSGLATTGTVAGVLLTWTNPSDSDFSHIEVWENSIDDQGTAIRFAERVDGTSYSRALASGSTLYFWIKAVDTSGNVSGFNATAGTAGTGGLVVTEEVAVDAVTAMSSGSTSGTLSLTTGFQTVVSAAITTTGEEVHLVTSMVLGLTANSSGLGALAVQIKRDSTVIWGPLSGLSIINGSNSEQAGDAIGLAVRDAPAAGSYTYSVEARYSAGVGGTASWRTILLLERKR